MIESRQEQQPCGHNDFCGCGNPRLDLRNRNVPVKRDIYNQFERQCHVSADHTFLCLNDAILYSSALRTVSFRHTGPTFQVPTFNVRKQVKQRNLHCSPRPPDSRFILGCGVTVPGHCRCYSSVLCSSLVFPVGAREIPSPCNAYL
jgi:hypothetical protein